MSNEIEEILEDEEVETEEVKTEAVAKKSNLDFLTKPVEEMTTEDAEALRKYALTQKAQKEHFKSKATTIKVEAQPLKTNQVEPTNLSEEIDIRFLKRDGVSDEDLEQLKFIQAGLKAQGKDVTLMEAQNNDLYKAYLGNKALTERKAKAQIISNGNGTSDSTVSQEEREAKREAAAQSILNQ